LVPKYRQFAHAVALWLLLVTPLPALALSGVSVDNQAHANFSAPGGGTQTADSNTVHVATASLPPSDLSVIKSTSATSPKQGDTIDFTISVKNNGSIDAVGTPLTINGVSVSKALVRDVIPANTTFNSITANGGAQSLYHIYGTPALTYTTTPPSDLTTVDEIGFAFDVLSVGQQRSFTFLVTIHNDAIGQITNIGEFDYNDGSSSYSADTNLVVEALPSFTPKITFYTNGQYTTPTDVTHAGSPLYLQASASGCNIDPQKVETHTITLVSAKTGDKEVYQATETGPNTGIFRVTPAVPTQDASIYPVVIGDGIMQVLANDSLTATLNGCGATATTAVILIDPAGVVFDSKTNKPVAGAVVSLIDVTGNGNGGKPNQPAVVLNFDGTSAPSTVTTGADGSFQFPEVQASTYKLQITTPPGYTFPSIFPPSQFPTRRIDPQGSYGGSFQVTVATGTVLLDVPVDPAKLGGLFIQKTASRAVAEVGDFVDYEVEIHNSTGALLNDVKVADKLPIGFSYQKGSATLNGSRIADPAGAPGPALTFSVGDLSTTADVKLVYRAKIGVGAALGDATNQAYAYSSNVTSNTARAVVRLEGGVFSDRGYIVGKVFADCDGNHLQNGDEPGVPGIRLYMEDGTYAITDDEGRYSFYDVSPNTHILKLDRYSLPANTMLESLVSRNGNDPGSVFVDMQNGGMSRADFAFSGCGEKLMGAIQARKKVGNGAAQEMELAKNQNQSFQTIDRKTDELRALPSSGIMTLSGPSSTLPDPVAPKAANAPAQQSAAKAGSSKTASTTQPAGANAASPEDQTQFTADVFSKLDNSLDIIQLHDGDILPFAMTNITVKGVAGSTFKLEVNGEAIPNTRVGKRSTLDQNHLQVWQYIGVQLKPGRNQVKVTQVDAFGNVRGVREITLLAPNKLGRLIVIPEKDMAYADGKTPVKITVRLTDSGDLPVTVRTPITLETTAGQFNTPDLDPKEPGTQVFITGGVATFELLPPIEPAQAMLRVTSGSLKAETKLDFVPELRPMIGAGMAELKFDFSGAHKRLGNAADLTAGIEQQLNSFAADMGGSASFASRIAMMMKGKVFHNYLLTVGYDSDKNMKDQMFRDAQPEKFYPVYGDGSLRGYDAQSTGKAFVRVDNGRSYAMFGDYTTASSSYSQSLSTYMRSLNGFKQHYENSKVSVTGFGARDSLKQTVIEIPANGTSGPYSIGTLLAVENSEKVQVVVRDRDQPSIVVSVTDKARFVDYEFDPLGGDLLFKSPIPTLDSRLDPVFIRVSFEVDQGGQKFWVGGADAQFKINDRLQFGGNFVKDSDPTSAYGLYGINTAFRVDAHTLFTAEAVESQHQAVGNGIGYRLEMKHEGERLNGRFYFGHTGKFFDNPNASLSRGRGEFGLRGDYKINDRTRLVSEVLGTQDVTTGGNRFGGEMRVERSLGGGMQMQFGFRHSQETATPAQPNSVGATPNDSSSIITKLTATMPHFSKGSVTAEYDQDVTSFDRQMAAIGGTYQVLPSSKVYVRHELISSLGSVYDLNSTQQQTSTVIGVDSSYLKDTRVFSEFRDRSVLDGREAEAAVGLSNAWHVAPGVVINTSLEDISTVNGKGNASMALTGGVEWTRSLTWRGSARGEWRASATSNSFLSTAGIAKSINHSWTLLGRNLYNVDHSKIGARGSHPQDRVQFGAAFRPASASKWNMLNMFELRFEKDTTDPTLAHDRTSAIFSSDINYQASSAFDLSGRYAVKLVDETARGIASSSGTHLLDMRATYDLSRKWDVGASMNSMFQPSDGSHVFGVGGEAGYMVVRNLWLSGGYNFIGFSSADLSGEDTTRQGPYIRLRFKFDEQLFNFRKEQK